MPDLTSPFLLPALLLLVGAGLVLSLLLLVKLGKLTDIAQRIDALERSGERLERLIHENSTDSRREILEQWGEGRREQREVLKQFEESLLSRINDASLIQKNQMEGLTSQIGKSVTGVEEELARMRGVVDQKLQETLDKKLTESFRLVSGQLEQVHQGLGEMRNLAVGVGDLKKALTNVKTRGIWGEVQLGALLEQILTEGQYATNVITKPGSNDRVEFAIRMPGGDDTENTPLLLPIDAKFPLEDYQRLYDAQEAGDKKGAELAGKEMEKRIKLEAKKIREKYIDPPHTTDFALLFLPSEGLYAEALRRPGLADNLQRDYRVTLAGPTTLTALLNSLQLGFRSLAIQKRASEVWELLGLVKTEFGKYGQALEATKKKLQEATNSIDQVEVRSRAIVRKLRDVERLPKPPKTSGETE